MDPAFQAQRTNLRIIKSTDTIPVEHPVFLIYGQPGICKSSLGYSAKDPLTLDFDRGAHRAANRRDTLAIDSWADIQNLMEHTEALDPYSTIVVDTVGRCLDLIIADIAITEPKKAPGGNPSQQGWGTLKNRFRNWMSTVRTLGKDVVLIAHDKEDKDNETRIVRPDIIGGSYGEIFKLADCVGYIYMSGKQRIIDFNPTDKWVGKNPGQWTPFDIPPIEKASDVLAKLILMAREAMGKISEASAGVAQQVDDWKIAIIDYTTADELNRAIPEILKMTAGPQAQVKKLLMDRASVLNIPFDREKKLFLPPAATAANW